MLHSFTSEGFVLRRRNFAEADRILEIYSKDRGKISLIAKGIRRTKSRKRGHLEVFNKIKFQAIPGKGPAILTEAETIDDYASIRVSIKKVSLAYYFMEVIAKIVHELEASPELYSYLSASMEELKSSKKLRQLRLEFATNVLKILGYWPKDKELLFPDEKLEEVIERQIFSKRVGKKMLE